MNFETLENFYSSGKAHLEKGPIALIFAEDQAEIVSTLQHHIKVGFTKVIAFGMDFSVVPDDLLKACVTVKTNLYEEVLPFEIVTKVNDLAVGQWVYYCFNAEYLFYPFCETRSVKELVTFNAEERRNVMMCYVIDLYAQDLSRFSQGISLTEAYFDSKGYYALARKDETNAHPKEQQLDIFGGLKRRFEEYVPYNKRRIDRKALFNCTENLSLNSDFTFNEDEYNTYSCPWHNNLTAAIMSFRTVKAFRINPASKRDIENFNWENSERFRWHSQQLLDLGFIEPGQWF